MKAVVNFFILSFLALATTFSLTTSFAAEIKTYSDVSPGAWYYDAVMEQSACGIFVGYDDGKFHPNDTITCGQFMTLLCRITGTNVYKPTSTKEWASHWAADRIWTAYCNKWITEAELAMITENVNSPILRKLAIKSLLCALGKADGLNSYEDYIDRAFELGILIGNENGDALAESCTTRAQAAQLLCRITNPSAKKAGCPYCGRSDHLTDTYCAAKAVDNGAVGRWSIPSVGVNVAIYAGSSQSITDAEDSANYIDFRNHHVIGDHKNQGFSAIKQCTVGTKAYLDTGDGVDEYICTGIISNGHNITTALTDANYNSVMNANIGGITCYTCNDCWQNVFIVFFQPA